jgi:hypothetical protein
MPEQVETSVEEGMLTTIGTSTAAGTPRTAGTPETLKTSVAES